MRQPMSLALAVYCVHTRSMLCDTTRCRFAKRDPWIMQVSTRCNNHVQHCMYPPCIEPPRRFWAHDPIRRLCRSLTCFCRQTDCECTAEFSGVPGDINSLAGGTAGIRTNQTNINRTHAAVPAAAPNSVRNNTGVVNKSTTEISVATHTDGATNWYCCYVQNLERPLEPLHACGLVDCVYRRPAGIQMP